VEGSGIFTQKKKTPSGVGICYILVFIDNKGPGCYGNMARRALGLGLIFNESSELTSVTGISISKKKKEKEKTIMQCDEAGFQ
jgi:hypothetical protein